MDVIRKNYGLPAYRIRSLRQRILVPKRICLNVGITWVVIVGLNEQTETREPYL
jgi:hypothetical protein